MKIVKSGPQNWENRHETFTQPVQDLYDLENDDAGSPLEEYNKTTKGIQAILGDAVKNNTGLRALGAGWSFTSVAATNGIMLNTKLLNSLFTLSAAKITPAYKGDINQLLFAQSGNGIWELEDYLTKNGRALKGCGASNGQTLAGAMSTGTHGSAFNFGATQDYVTGIHLIVSATRSVYLERKSYPVVSAAFIADLQTELIQDDDLFNAALVSFGSFGFIHGVMIETEPLYLLECYRLRMPVDDKLMHVMQTLDFSNIALPCGKEVPYHFQTVINPYDVDGGAFVTVMYKRPYKAGYPPPVHNNEGIGPGDDAPCFVGKLAQVVPALVPKLVTQLVNSNYAPYPKQLGTLAEIFDNTDTHGKVLSTAMGIPIDQVAKAYQVILDLNKVKGPFVGVLSFRYAKQSAGTLAFTRFAPTCILELDSVKSPACYRFYKACWTALDKQKIPYSFHWGKINGLNKTRIKKMYGKSLTAWLAARNTLLDKTYQAIFTNDQMREWGLGQ
jgi:FAD/FMN-containing dehydrogenase